MTIRLKMLALGARLLMRPLFRVTSNPVRAGQRIDALSRLTGIYRPYTLRLKRPLGGRHAVWLQNREADCSKVILYLHGGAYFAGSSATHGPMLSRLAEYAKVPVWVPDYTLVPEAPFPAAYNDALAAWDDLIARGYAPSNIILGGDSAGGGLMFALLSKILSRGQRPAGAFSMSAWTDLGMTGLSVAEVGDRDPAIPYKRLGEAARAYHGDTPNTHPRVSPLFATFTNPPHVLMHIGAPEVLEDDTYRMAERLRKAGGRVSVRTYHGAPHVWHLGELWVPEARDALLDIAHFCQTSFDKASR